MARIAYLLLCHKDPDAVIAQAQRMTAAGDFISIHFDRRAPQEDYNRIAQALSENPRVVFPKRFRCGWGAWSLVAATLSALEAALDAFPRATHFYLISGDCMPIKSAEYCRKVLDGAAVDYIESNDFFRSDWIKTGFRDERLIYRHIFNERTHRRLFYASFDIQKRLKLTRKPPSGIEVMIGSQWWCLRRSTAEAILDFCAERRDVLRFFRTTWIPDETFFQTLVRHLVPSVEIRNRTPTFLIFTDYGMPVNFHDDHYDLLLSQNFFFARKISPGALELKRRLGDLYAATGVSFRISGEGRKVHAFLTGHGRVGRRFAPRFWEREATLGLDREILILTCKKWHIAKSLAKRITEVTGIPSVGYLFNEHEAGLPDLGGIEKTMQKRNRHRRALLRMLLDARGGDRLVICADTSDLDLMRDLERDRCTTRILHLDCDFDIAYLRGHAQRQGILAANADLTALQRILPTLQADMAFEAQALRDEVFAHLSRLTPGDDLAQRAAILADFLTATPETAHRVADMPNLFDD